MVPYAILASSSLLCGGLALLLPETTGVDLPATVAEAEAFGRDEGFFHIPWIEERKRRKKRKLVGDCALE